MTFDPTKPVRTRDGRPARILCTDLGCVRHPIVAAYTNPSGAEIVNTYTAEGFCFHGARRSDADLVNIPDMREQIERIWEAVRPNKDCSFPGWRVLDWRFYEALLRATPEE